MANSVAKLFHSTRLIYRAIEDEDEAFLHSIQSDVEALANSSSSLPVPETRASSKKWMDYLRERTLIAVIICLPTPEGDNKSPTPIGVITLTKPDGHHRSSYISVDIKDGFRAKGYGSEAIRWALDWGFRMAGLHRIGIETYSWNEGATHLYEKLGFTLEGRKRHLYWFNGAWGDFLSYSILEDEWAEIKKKLESK